MIHKLSKENKIDIGQIIRYFAIVRGMAKRKGNPVANYSRIRQRFTGSTTHTKLVDTVWRTKTRLLHVTKAEFCLKERNFDLSNLQVEVLSMEVPLIPNVLYQESDYYKPLNEAWQIGDLQKSCFGILDGTPKGPSPLDFSNDSSRASFGWKVPNFINLTVLSKIIGPTQVH